MNSRFIKALLLGTVLSLLASLLSELVNSVLVDPYVDRHQLETLSRISTGLEAADDREVAVDKLQQQYKASIKKSTFFLAGDGDVELSRLTVEGLPMTTGEEQATDPLISGVSDWSLSEFTHPLDEVIVESIRLSDGSMYIIEAPYQLWRPAFVKGLIAWILHTVAIALAVWSYAVMSRSALNDLQVSMAGMLSAPVVRSADPLASLSELVNNMEARLEQYEHQHEHAIADQQNLLASVAHEFRSPLARLQFANEMAMTRQGDEQQRLLVEADHAAHELGELIRETLGYSRLRSEASSLRRTSVSLNTVLSDLRGVDAFPERNVKLVVNACDKDIHVDADEKLLLRALTNLVSNAQRHAKHLVSVSTDVTDCSVVLRVTDDGHGIPYAQAEQIFEPFYRLEESRSRDSGGFGLGLSIVRSIIEKHGATITLVKKAEHTCFEIVWPRSG